VVTLVLKGALGGVHLLADGNPGHVNVLVFSQGVVHRTVPWAPSPQVP
jgi:hypothetical protein